VTELTELGISPKALNAVRGFLNESKGIVLVTGPAGAGKTTTLYAALAYLSAAGKSIFTAESRIEGKIPSVRQTHVTPADGRDFNTVVRSLVRQDPDVIMIGELRDPETAQLALRAAHSGILVLTTLQADDSAGVVPRLIDMGLEPHLLATSLAGVIAQRVLQTICAGCKATASHPPEMLTALGLTDGPDVTLYAGNGCAACDGTGYRGRTGAFEVLVPDAAIQALIRERAGAHVITQAAVSSGMVTLLDDALSKAVRGQTTIEEVVATLH
jgi:type II secretory ATPase GspE/PulE/Tfp pilus assembly ATPase PilB-like protein